MKRIYIAGKLAADAVDYNNNRKRMLHYALKVKKAGFSVYVPCMVEQLALIDTEDWEYSDYFNNSQPWLEISDAVFLVPGWETSSGTQLEIELAKDLNIPIYDDLSKLIKDLLN